MKLKTSYKIALDSLGNHLEDALCTFVECLTSAGSCTVYDNKKVMKENWFDEDCIHATNKQQQQKKKKEESFTTHSVPIYKE